MAVRFDASTEFYSATTGLPTRRDTWTATFWAYISVDRNAYSAPFSLVDDLCMTSTDGTTLWFLPDDTFSQAIVGQNMPVGAWYRVAVIRNGTTGKLIMGPEGGALQTFTDTTWPTNATAPGSMRIGSTSFGDWLNGRVSGFKMWNAALSDAEVVEELKQKLPVRTSGILRVHKFTVAETTDYSGNGRTLSGGAGTSTEADPANLPDTLVQAQTVTVLAGVPSAEAVGTASVVPGTATVTSVGVASTEAVGVPTLLAGPISVSLTGVPSAEAVGTPTLRMTLTLTGVPSAEAVGVPTVIVGDTVALTGVPSAEVVGTPTVVPGPVTVSAVGGVPSAEAVGTPSVVLTVLLSGVPSAEVVGTPALTAGPVQLTLTGVESAEAIGQPSVVPGPVALTVAGVPSGEQVGTPRIRMTISVVGGVPSAEQVGTPTLLPGLVVLTLIGVASAEAVGIPELLVTLDSSVRRVQPITRIVPRYEVLVVARVPQPAGPPMLLDVDALEFSTLTWGSTLSRPQSLTVTTSISTITEPVRQRFRDPLRLPTELWVLRNGKQVFAGPLLGGQQREDGDDLDLRAGGLLTYLEWMIVAASLRFDQQDQFAIAAKLIDQWQALEFGHFGIDTSRVGASGRLRDGSYERDEIHHVSRRLEELGARRDGFDAEIDPTTRALQLWYPGKGVDRSTGDDAVVFDGRSIDGSGGFFSVAPGDVASDAFGSGSSAGADAGLWSEQPNLELRAAFGRTAATGSWSDVSEQITLDDHVAALRDARGEPLRAPGRKVRVTPDTDLDLYGEGDTIGYELDALLGIGGAFRIRSRQVSVAETGQESVDLEFV